MKELPEQLKSVALDLTKKPPRTNSAGKLLSVAPGSVKNSELVVIHNKHKNPRVREMAGIVLRDAAAVRLRQTAWTASEYRIVADRMITLADMITETKPKKAVTANDLMAAEFAKNPESATWTKKQWAAATGKSLTAIQGADLWNSDILQQVRASRDAMRDTVRRNP